MWPWGHLAVSYLAYLGVRRGGLDRVPADRPVLVLAVATQFPDLVDKTLAWQLGVLPHGRSLAHSLLTAAALIGVVGWLGARYGRRDLALAAGAGYLAHLAADAYASVLTGQYGNLAFLAWPLLRLEPEPGDPSVVGYFVGLYADLLAGRVDAFFAFELALTLLAVGLWAHHGFPGLPIRGRGVGPAGQEG